MSGRAQSPPEGQRSTEGARHPVKGPMASERAREKAWISIENCGEIQKYGAQRELYHSAYENTKCHVEVKSDRRDTEPRGGIHGTQIECKCLRQRIRANGSVSSREEVDNAREITRVAGGGGK